MNLLRGISVALGMCLIGYTGFSQEKKDTVAAKTDTLKLSVAQAQQYALENNRSILNANLDIEMAKKKVWETTAIGLPQVSAKGSFQYMPTLSSIVDQLNSFGSLQTWTWYVTNSLSNLDPNNFTPRNTTPSAPVYTPIKESDLKWSLAGDLTVSQLLFSGSYLVGLQSAKVYESLSQLNKVKSKQDVLESVINSYFTVLIARENKNILDSTYQNLLKTLTDMQAMGKNGFVEETDIDQLQITVSNVKTSVDFITRQQDLAEKLLKLQLGVDLDKPLILTDSLKSLIDALSYEKLLLTDFVLDNNVNYQMLDAQVKASGLILKLRKSEFLPDLAAFYQYEKQFNSHAITFNPPNIIGVTLNVPIFSSGARLSRVSQAKMDLQKSINTRDQTADALKVDFYNSKSGLLNALDKYHTESSNIVLAKRIYDRALIKYTNGMISSTDLTTIQNQYLTAQSNYYTAIQNLIISKNKLEKMLTKSEY
ncbi:MAG TPA: TolC family protein [Bacteroidales bacterium]